MTGAAPSHETQGHGHRHDHGHGHAHDSLDADSDRRWIGLALAFILAFMGVEIAVGIIANSLALLSDAAHMATDAAAVALALVALAVAARPASSRYTFGLGRAEILSAQVNGAALLVLGAIIGVEAVRRLFDPPQVEGGLVIVVGVLGALVNVASAWALSKAQRRSLNVEGARAHVLTDLYSSLTATVAGVLVLTTGFLQADGIAALLVCALMLRSGWALVRESGRVLLEGTPTGFDAAAIGTTLAGQPGVREVHDLHVWEVTSGFPALSAHVLVARDADCHATRRELERVLRERFALTHTTLQVDHEIGEGLDPRTTPLPMAGRPADRDG